MHRAAIIGNTTWGNTLGTLLSKKNTAVKLWTRTQAEESNQPPFSRTGDIEEALDAADLVIWAVPSQTLRQNVIKTKSFLTNSMLLVSAAKGLEADSGKRMSQVMAEEIATSLRRHICALSGPNLAREIARGLPAASIVASQDIATAERARGLMQSPDFLLFASDDIVGVELGGAVKNIIALGAGMMDGLSLGDNAKAAFIAWGWAEAVSLGVALGAKTSTFFGLAGLGDLIATCSSNLSRNHHVGHELAKGRSLSEIRASMRQIAEGVPTTMAVHHLAEALGIELPTMDIIYNVLFSGLQVSEAYAELSKLMEHRCQPEFSLSAIRTKLQDS
jgi:glycerol-3-phosphate dehydrogenase (NAD(P)+)